MTETEPVGSVSSGKGGRRRGSVPVTIPARVEGVGRRGGTEWKRGSVGKRKRAVELTEGQQSGGEPTEKTGGAAVAEGGNGDAGDGAVIPGARRGDDEDEGATASRIRAAAGLIGDRRRRIPPAKLRAPPDLQTEKTAAGRRKWGQG